MGELHVEIAQTHLRRDHGVEIRIGAPQVAYRDTVRRSSRVAYKHEKQDGGVGQFARVVLELEPGGRGSGIVFTDETVGGTVPRVFVPGVEKGVRNAAARGLRGGYPLVDLVVRLIDGEHHVRDSSPLSFELAASAAFQEAVRSSLPVLLEPLMVLEVSTPEESVGSVIGDLSARRGAIQKLEPRNRLSVITVHAPLATLFGYVPALRSLTHGRGTAVMKPLGYEIVPERLVSRILAA
jgi:elongation factor G